jgi:exopolysaccharide production protein ExoQ
MLRQNAQVKRLVLFTVFIISAMSFGPFNQLLYLTNISALPGASEEVTWQTNSVFALWVIVFCLSLLPGALATRINYNKMLLPALFIGYAALSAAWSDQWIGSATKAVALIFCSITAVRLAAMIRIGEMLACLRLGLTAVVFASCVIAIENPAIGVARLGLSTTDIEHEGLWLGMFGDKQSLGFAAAYLFYLSFVRVLRKQTILDILVCAMALVALIYSGCRGAALIDGLLIAALITARTNKALIPWLTRIILVELGLGIAQLVFFAFSGYPYIPVFDTQIDLSNRTFIWQYAAQYWTNSPLFGFGLNGFWSNPKYHYEFSFIYKWVLDNFHSGYLGIFMETGIVGFMLFAATTWRLCSDLTVRLMRDRLRSIDLETAFGVLLLTFTINLTETYFLRSTNLLQAYFMFLMAKLLIERAPTEVRRFAAKPQPVVLGSRSLS